MSTTLQDPTDKVTRRRFLTTATAVSTFVIVPRHVLGGPGEQPPSGKMNIAGIGVGGRGMGLLTSLGSQNIVAVCDPDDRHLTTAAKQWPAAKRHRDFRRMIETQQDIDAVVVATPDHLHFVASMWAIKSGKHVYCEKPLTRTIGEARVLAKVARESKVATQMGNQGNADEGVRLMQEWIGAGALGTVSQVHCWTNKPVWPQGIHRPSDTPPVPAELDWDLWLGPAAQRPYHPAYLPFVWRGWWDFGSCSLGDMGCHVLNSPWRALKLGLPTSVEAYSNGCTDETGPRSSIIYYDFPARGDLGPVRLTWYDGGMMSPRPPELEHFYRMGDNEGCLFVGDKASMICSCYGGAPRILPTARMQEFKATPKTIPRSPGHLEEWLAASRGGPPAGSHFEHSAILAEVVQLGNLGVRFGANQKENGRPVKLLWDAAAGRVTNEPDANRYLLTEPRKGWEA
ncbi:MAG: Gfo/Idh/MocA family oxidoreductase [Planctomycetota bacterium]|nr:Gfo/Idh/MocA family oxidoreductase [Planctomycetota bacterium]